jgi:hypothetical protein
MKTILLVLFCSLASLALAADLELADGRIFKNYRITGQTATTVTVRYTGGMAKVDKAQLPAAVLAKYPVDEKAAAAELAAIAEGKARYEAQVRAAAEVEGKARRARAAEAEENRARLAAITAEVEQARRQKAISRQLAADDAAEALPEKILAAVRLRADRYFKTEHGPSSKLSSEVKYSLEAPRAVEGWGNTYEVTGVGWYEYYESGPYHGFGSERQWFTARVEIDAQGKPKVIDFSPRNGPP